MKPLKELREKAIADVEIMAITRALKLAKGKKTAAARILDIDYKTLLTKIKFYNIS
jgi:transcriptional regulator with PAS, ATPase and Fis domain